MTVFSSALRLHWIYGLFILLAYSCQQNTLKDKDWAHYRGDPLSLQYAELSQINKENVHELKPVWEYRTGDADSSGRSQIQCNPLVIDGVLYGTSPKLKLFAIDAVTGEHIWTFDPFSGSYDMYGMGVNRGLAYHKDTKTIFFSAADRLYSIDASTGQTNHSFGENGSISLHTGLEWADVKDLFIVSNTPGIIFRDMIIMGSRVSESIGAAPGHIRAFDVRTGDMRWIFHTIPRPGTYGSDTWPEDASKRIGGANAWAGFSLDEENEIVYVPTGSASFDFYGGDRPGDNLFANSIIALKATTGERIWHYQTIHHDIWDKDLPMAPSLVTLTKEGTQIPALIQPTKNGMLFVLNRLTGEPLYPIEEVPVAASDIVGELASKTQPVPTFYPPFSRTKITLADVAKRTEEAKIYAESMLNTLRFGNPFIPLSEQGTVVFPGLDGGGEWGGASFDPAAANLITNSSEMPWNLVLDKVVPATPGERIYASYCQSCHGENFEGGQLFGNVPGLKHLSQRLSLPDVVKIVHTGKGVMPAFAGLSEERINSVYEYINGTEQAEKTIGNRDWPYPYRMRGYNKLVAPDGYPIIDPPWGQLTSINMNNGQINWQVPLGEEAAFLPEITGTESYGGPVVTAGGLIFIAATKDEKIRAFDKDTGKELWQYQLPAAGYATPAVYQYKGKQYIVIACGGGKLGTPSGDSYVAFALE